MHRPTMRTTGFLKKSALLGLLCFLISLSVGLLLDAAGMMNDVEEDPVVVSEGVLLVLVAPIIETGLIFLIARVLRGLLSGRTLWGVIALLMAGFHALVHVAWGLIVLIPFLIYARIAVSSQQPASLRFWQACAPHVFSNLLAFVLVVVTSHYS